MEFFTFAQTAGLGVADIEEDLETAVKTLHEVSLDAEAAVSFLAKLMMDQLPQSTSARIPLRRSQ